MLEIKLLSSLAVKMKPAKNALARRVAVTGIGVMAPNGTGAGAYCRALRQGVSGAGAITLFDTEGLECRVAAEVKNFSSEDYFRGREARRVGRAVPLLLAATEEALRSARVCWRELDLATRQSWGVVIGSGGGAPDFTEEQYRLYFSDHLRRVSAYNVSSSTPGSLSSEVSIRFDLRGPSHLVSTGCTSSTDALGYAFNLIRFGVAERLVSGGVDATITPGIMRGFCVMGAVSISRNEEPERASRPFDRQRDGFVLGEGPGSSSWRNGSGRWSAARRSLRRSSATARPAMPTIACASLPAAKSRRGP
jgi:3-oxoacyl-[acyl-carrier-protein] synthase II